MTSDQIIHQTRKWITDVVVGCNFCPFAAREVKRNSIHYQVVMATETEDCLQAFLDACIQLDEDSSLETTLLIYPNAFDDFREYLDLADLAEKLLDKQGYEGIYQVASFHPLYRFAGAPEDDAANYTNRSPYPMLHLLREDSVEAALEHYKDPEQIPDRNIEFARNKGTVYMKMLRDACME